jgi:cation transport ATPase
MLGKKLIYIGDSINDLPALLHADIGIILGEPTTNSASAVAARFGIHTSLLDSTKSLAQVHKDMCERARMMQQPQLLITPAWKDLQYLLQK